MVQSGFANISVEDAGLFLSNKYSFLGASLDGGVNCDGQTWGLEIKCPYSKLNSSLDKSLQDKTFFLKKGKEVELRRNHPYFYQVQGQMYCTGLKRVDFVVWFGDKEPLFVSSIDYDEQFLESILPKLKYFYCRSVLPEQLTKRVERGLKLYLHGGWKNYSNNN